MDRTGTATMRDLREVTRLHETLRGAPRAGRARDWLLQVDAALKLHERLGASVETQSDADTVEQFLASSESGELKTLPVHFLAARGRVAGKVVITTLHSSKGREIDCVILAGMQEGILPTWKWNGRRRAYDDPTRRQLAEAQRLFYVGFTRAKKVVYLASSPGFVNARGYRVDLGPSRFIAEIRRRLEQ